MGRKWTTGDQWQGSVLRQKGGHRTSEDRARGSRSSQRDVRWLKRGFRTDVGK